FTAPKCWSR
ncbi:hypothetical protein D043_2275B, partial [Vibrio parahaemolyticus EKP-021]